MTQSSFIVGALLAAFVLFLAARGRLATYAAVLWGPSTGGGSINRGGSGDVGPGGVEPADAPPGSNPGRDTAGDIWDYFPALPGLPH